MIKEVLPPYRRFWTVNAVLVTAFLAGCALGAVSEPVQIPHVDPPAEGVPFSVWTLPTFDTVCESYWLRPAFECRSSASYAPSFDGCAWTCPRADRM